MPRFTPPITIRDERPDDAPALQRLAILDSSTVPASPLLLAELDGSLVVALSLADGASVADPFVPTADLVALLRAHARRVQHGRDGRAGARRVRPPSLGLRPVRRLA